MATTSYIPTGCRDVDDLLQGGIKTGIITEIIGPPSVGKTTFALQLCLNVQLDAHLGGLDGYALYVGTNNSLSSTRLYQMATAFVEQWNDVLRGPNFLLTRPDFQVDQVLDRIFITKCITKEELHTIISTTIPNFLNSTSHTNTKLVVIDGIDFPLFMDLPGHRQRMDLIHGYVKILENLKNQHDMAIVLTNISTPKFDSTFGSGNGEHYYLPYLGPCWNFHPNQILKLSFTRYNVKVRKMELIKSSFNKEGSEYFRIEYKGIRDYC